MHAHDRRWFIERLGTEGGLTLAALAIVVWVAWARDPGRGWRIAAATVAFGFGVTMLIRTLHLAWSRQWARTAELERVAYRSHVWAVKAEDELGWLLAGTDPHGPPRDLHEVGIGMSLSVALENAHRIAALTDEMIDPYAARLRRANPEPAESGRA
jgi:hypothetical protein